MAGQIAAHVTAIYPEELDDLTALGSRVQRAAEATEPFQLGLGPLFYVGSPADGVFLRIGDPSGGAATFRAHAGLDSDTAFPLHVTIVHPRTSSLGAEAWHHLEGWTVSGSLRIETVAITAFDGDCWATVARYPLLG